MGTARDEKLVEKMSDIDYDNSEETNDTDGDHEVTAKKEDEADDDNIHSIKKRAQNHESDGNAVAKLAVLPLARNSSRKLHSERIAEKGNRYNRVIDGGHDAGVVPLEQKKWDVFPGNMKRRRQHGKNHGQRAPDASWNDLIGAHAQDWEEDADDNDWTPVEAVTLPPHWFCTNCTMPNFEKFVICVRCGENRKSGILTGGHLASSSKPLQRLAESVGMTRTSKDSRTESRRTVIGFDERMLLHDETPMKSHPHPERSDRLRAIIAGLAAEGIFPGRCEQGAVREITRLELEQVHTRAHVDAIEETCSAECSYFTPDTYANKNSSVAAKVAAGISAELARAIVKGEVHNGFALVRPPGHHAEEYTIMGFCLHNNAGVAAKAAQAAGAKKVLIVDWDVHHGNGTQDIFEADPSVLFISLHRHEGGNFYPGTGSATEVGTGKGEGYSVNIPWNCGGIGDNDYIFAFLHVVLPIAKQFNPDVTIVSAGFDAADGDPLGGFKVSPSGYALMTSMLSSLAGGKMLLILEGGYNLRSISASSSAVIKVLLGDSPGPVPEDVQPTEAGAISLLDVFAVQSQYWSSLQVPEFLGRLEHLAASKRQRKGKRPRGNRKLRGPVWWTWGRRREVYQLWFVERLHRKKIKGSQATEGLVEK